MGKSGKVILRTYFNVTKDGDGNWHATRKNRGIQVNEPSDREAKMAIEKVLRGQVAKERGKDPEKLFITVRRLWCVNVKEEGQTDGDVEEETEEEMPLSLFGEEDDW